MNGRVIPPDDDRHQPVGWIRSSDRNPPKLHAVLPIAVHYVLRPNAPYKPPDQTDEFINRQMYESSGK